MKNSASDLTPASRHSLRDYWTQGTIASLCAALSELGGVRIELRDERGFVLDPSSYRESPRVETPIPEGSSVLPIIVTDERIGSIVVHPHDHELTHSALIDQLTELIAKTASEMCTDVANLRYRVSEVAVLYRLSSLLVRGGRVHDTLQLTLELALDVLGLEAGAIMLLPEDSEALPRVDLENELERSASLGLSEDWLLNPVPLSKDREFDRLALRPIGSRVEFQHLQHRFRGGRHFELRRFAEEHRPSKRGGDGVPSLGRSPQPERLGTQGDGDLVTHARLLEAAGRSQSTERGVDDGGIPVDRLDGALHEVGLAEETRGEPGIRRVVEVSRRACLNEQPVTQHGHLVGE